MNINYDLLEKTVLLFWDENQNFNKTVTQQKIGKDLFKEVALIENLDSFIYELSKFTDLNQKFLFLIHLFHNEENKGYDNFKSSKIHKNYPNLRPYLISSVPKRTIYENEMNQPLDVYSYDGFHEKIGTTFIPQTKEEIISKLTPQTSIKPPNKLTTMYDQIDYAIITALYDDEFEEIDKLFDWIDFKETQTINFKIGQLKGNSSINVVASVQNETGMVDASILATIMIETYKPKYLLMPGVCGGISDLSPGSIIIASGIFTFQKGKISDVKDKNGQKIHKYYDISKNPIDLHQIFDENQNLLKIHIEKFESENDLIKIDPLVKSKIQPHVKSIKEKINEPYKTGLPIDIIFEKLACSTMVINKEDYFNENIKPLDRKTAGVEMESYGIARACQFANDGKTKFVIFKAVMDNMKNKTDGAKSLAAFTSAQFLKHLLSDNILQ
ncbi:hypothetical protein QNI19_38630 [Cytophagaceae bacterium DM2B3-1]|uniref:Nucleoside phosphorylase domain-containing protein n=1 Tax=Xanthocytophaga flava TaxID=3048013 RepID=A0ABT7CYU4_9BACT|nr:hypothetical protein [Xanthocytophaga flavus]MDJ1498908.1 hypothetical protein [Xanthocytophaga flavus]